LKTVEHLEGRTRLIVPAASLTQDPPPTSPVFFNPVASLNRDISVAITEAVGGSTFCDSMAGVGARGIRIAKEAGSIVGVTLVDFNEDALKLARRSARLNGIGRKCEFSHSETSSYLYSRYGREERFDYVDVDPFGSPVRQLQAALCATSDGGVLSVTATDTAVLCGVYPRVSKRRYGALPLNNHFHHESGTRILIGAIARQAANLDAGVEPVAAHSTRHYVRVFLRVRTGASKADSALEKLGYVSWCPACGHTWSSEKPEDRCQECQKRVRVAGPLWIAGLAQRQTVEEAREEARSRGFGTAVGTLDSLIGVDDFPPWSFSIEQICSSLGSATVSESDVRSLLGRSGFRTLRQPFEKTGLKTDASYKSVKDAVREAAVERRGGDSGRRVSEGR
jgi:tRNA (guanine26-N2/guanine27-N2)-dimethyltransferase